MARPGGAFMCEEFQVLLPDRNDLENRKFHGKPFGVVWIEFRGVDNIR